MFDKRIIFEKFNTMRKFYFILLLVLAFGACKEKKSEQPDKAKADLSVLERIAQAHGFEQWSRVKEIGFTFNVDRDTIHLERSWIWKTLENQVTAVATGDTITYNRSDVDSTLQDVDSRFINDKYWT